MDDYYSLLGIDADASVDDIRGAYRDAKEGLDTSSDAGKAGAARLNKAWNVLSDPYQRGRYDEKRAVAAEDGTLGAEDDDTQASSNGRSSSGTKGTARESRQARAQAARDSRAAQLNKTPTITPPAGTHYPATKQRIFAMLIDLVVVFAIFIIFSQVGAQAVAKSQKPAVVKQVNNLNDQITALDKQKSDADKAVSNDKKVNNTDALAADQKKSDDLKKQITDTTKQRDDALAKLNAYFLGGIGLAFGIGLLYLAVPSALTGRTLGKRLQHLKALREDGSPLGWSGAFRRFGLIAVVTLALFVLLRLGPLAGVIVLFGFTLWMRNPNMQGLHDRFAHTIVVSDDKD